MKTTGVRGDVHGGLPSGKVAVILGIVVRGPRPGLSQLTAQLAVSV